MTVAMPDDARRGHLLRPVKNAVFSLVRRGPRDVMWTLPGCGLGNFLYQWLWAHAGSREGLERKVLEQPEMGEWLDLFPQVRERFVIPREEVRLTDHRTVFAYSVFTGDTRDEIDAFVRELILPSDHFREAHETPHADELLVHVRRGSYYDLPQVRRIYGMDVVSYVREAVARSVALDGVPSSIRVITNDRAWCAEHLGWLRETAPTVFGGRGSSAADDFRELSEARRLVLGNSTFSYWAAHVSGVRHGDNHASIIAPAFAMREGDTEQRSSSLDPRWSVIDELPNGWAEPGHHTVGSGTPRMVYLLTAAVRPHSSFLGRGSFPTTVSDPEVRLQEYCEAARQWRITAAHTGGRLLIVETSGHGDVLRERLGLDDDDVIDVSAPDELYARGKGAVEALAVDEVLTRTGLRDHDILVKVTGRLSVANAREALAGMRPEVPRMRRSLDRRTVDTRFFAVGVGFWREHLTGMAEECDDEGGRWLERVVGHRLIEAEYHRGATLERFPVVPCIVGRSATTGEEYARSARFWAVRERAQRKAEGAAKKLLGNRAV